MNKRFVNQMKYMKIKTEQLVPEVYAALALALIRTTNMTTEDVYDVFAESQAIWNESVTDGINVCDMCIQETGIDVRRRVKE